MQYPFSSRCFILLTFIIVTIGLLGIQRFLDKWMNGWIKILHTFFISKSEHNGMICIKKLLSCFQVTRVKRVYFSTNFPEQQAWTALMMAYLKPLNIQYNWS